MSSAAARLPVPRPFARTRGWRPLDRLGYVAAWFVGVLVCALTATIVIYMLVRGLQYLSVHTIFDHPTAEQDQSKSGGFLDPLVGTFVIVSIGIAIAGPIGVASAVWLTEYGKPRWLGRAVESGVEVVAGTPSIVLALFGLLVFSHAAFSLLSFTGEGGAVFGRSFLIAGLMMALEGLPLVVTATRESLNSVPDHVREASYALGKTRIATIRRVLMPAARPGMATGAMLAVGRMMGDTAIVVVLLGGSLQLQGVGGVPILSTLRGTGSTLTSYVYDNSPAGEGGAPQKAYLAAFVLLMLIIGLNFVVERIARRSREALWIR